MTSQTQSLENRLRWSGALVVLGLLIEAVCLLWTRPLAFIILVGGGGLFCAAGILLYLYTLVSLRDEE
jgi:hypothetical protein